MRAGTQESSYLWKPATIDSNKCWVLLKSCNLTGAVAREVLLMSGFGAHSDTRTRRKKLRPCCALADEQSPLSSNDQVAALFLSYALFPYPKAVA